MKNTKTLTNYRFGKEREITDVEVAHSFPSLVANLETLSNHCSEDDNWIKVMAWLGSKGEILEYLDFRLPIPIGSSIEVMLEEKVYSNIVTAYILGFQSYTYSSYKNYISAMNKDNSKSIVDTYRNRWRENNKYLADLKSRYLTKSAARLSRDQILEQDSDEEAGF